MRQKALRYLALATSFICFTVIAFIVPIEHNLIFGLAYGFSVLAFISQIGIWEWAFPNANTLNQKFLGIALPYLGVIYLILQIIAFFVCLTIPVKIWITVIVNVVIFGVFALLFISVDAARVEIQNAEKDIESKTTFMRTLCSELELLAISENDAKIKEELSCAINKVKYSDPLDTPECEEVNSRILSIVSKMKNVCINSESINEVITLIERRNNIIKNKKRRKNDGN